MPYNTTAIPPRKEATGQNQLPLSRVKKIISQDSDINMCSNNAAFVITLATEMFIQHLAEEASTQAKLERKPRRNIQYKDIANAVSHQDNLEFLEDVVPKTVPLKKIRATAQATQAKYLADKAIDERPTTSSSLPNGTSNAAGASTPSVNGVSKSPAQVLVNGDAAAFSAQPRIVNEEREADDPSEQLEMEMRQAADSIRDGDVHMTG